MPTKPPLTDYSYRQLIQMHQHAGTEKRKAEIEHALWENLPNADRSKYPKGRRRFLKDVLGVSTNAAAHRCYLLTAIANDLLWPRVNAGKLPLTTAVRLHREARNEASDKQAIRIVLAAKLTEYDSWPVRMMRGKAVRVRVPSMKRAPKKDAVAKTTYEKTGARQFWGQLRTLIGNYMKSELPETDVVEDKFWNEFETDINTAIDDFKRRVTAAKRKRADESAPSYSRREIRTAFETLCLDVPRKGKPIDMKAVKRNKRKLTRMYHPDTGNDGGDQEAYQAVIEATALIEELAAHRNK